MTEKTSFRKTTEILLPFLIYYVVCNAVNWFLWQLLELTLQHGGESWQAFLSAHAASVRGIVSGIYILAGLFAIGKTALREIKPLERLHTGQIPFVLFLCIFALSSAIGLNLLFALSGFSGSSEVYRKVSGFQFDTPFWVGIIVFGILSPLAEEVLFRGIIFNRMKKYFSLLLSMVISSLLFGIYHGNIVQGVYGTVMGFLIVFVYYKFDTFLAPFLFHSVANISIFAMTYRTETVAALMRPGLCILFTAIAAACLLFLILPKQKLNILP